MYKENLHNEKSTENLKTRENRLRRNAAKKGLYIKKRKWKKYYSEYDYESFDGYCVGICAYGMLVWAEDTYGENAPTLAEAEEIVSRY